MSGGLATVIAARSITPWPLEPRRATLCRISALDGKQALDRALVTVFVAPDSFTGEDIVEISGHGGLYVPALVMETFVYHGARVALLGEFNRRAVLKGKIEVTQDEAYGVMVDDRSAVITCNA